MLAQTIIPKMVLFEKNSPSQVLPMGTIVFVAKQEAGFSQIIYDQCVYRVRTANLLPIKDQKPLSKMQIVLFVKKQEQARQDNITEQFERLIP